MKSQTTGIHNIDLVFNQKISALVNPIGDTAAD